VKITNFIVGMENMAVFRAVRDSCLNSAAPPASTTIGVPAPARAGGLFEIEAIVALPGRAQAKARSKQTARRSKRKVKGARRKRR
jgi:hypothetical protein